MQHKRLWISILLVTTVLLRSPDAPAVESDPLPAPRGTPRERAISVYNEGVVLMRDKHYVAAQEKFEQARTLEETLAEAYNNLAFSLCQQGTHNFALALQHYNRALELKPDLARAYMYRGVLFTQSVMPLKAMASSSQPCCQPRRLGMIPLWRRMPLLLTKHGHYCVMPAILMGWH